MTRPRRKIDYSWQLIVDTLPPTLKIPLNSFVGKGAKQVCGKVAPPYYLGRWGRLSGNRLQGIAAG